MAVILPAAGAGADPGADPGAHLRVGLDLGGSKVLGVLLEGDTVRRLLRVPTDLGPEGVVGSAAEVVRGLCDAAGIAPSRLAGVGMALPGIVDPTTGTVSHAVNLRIHLPDVPVGALLSEQLGGVPVTVENDLNAAALGAAETLGYSDMAFLALGTGLAAGLPVPLGADAQALRHGWGRPLEGGPDASDAAACHYLFTDPARAEGFGQAFMFEGGRFVRMDVDDPALAAPGGGRVGMDAAAVAALYPGRVEEQPHKYVEGARILRVTGDGEAVLVFATDAAGVVRSWRVGLPPQVDYVEGCG